MKVKELIAQLESMDQELEVMFSHPSHDYWKTQVASPVKHVMEERVEWSEYHRKFSPKSEEHEEKEKDKTVVLLEE